MKRLFVCLALVSLLLTTGSGHAEDTATLSELRKDAPDRLAFSCVADGKTVAIDAPVLLPEGDTLPILKAAFQKVDLAGLRKIYPAVNENMGPESLEYTVSLQIAPNGGGKISVPMKYASREPILREEFIEGPLPNNDLPPDAPLRLVQSLLGLAGVEADLRVDAQTVAGAAFYQQKVPGVDDLYMQQLPPEQIKIDRERPIRGYDVGFYQTGYAQYVEGAKVFSTNFSIPESDRYEPYLQMLSNTSTMLSEKDFWVWLSAVKPTETVEADAKLLPFSQIERILRERVEAGKLLSVHEITLGYGIRVEKGENSWDLSKSKLELYPYWQVRGYDTSFDPMFENWMRSDRTLTDLDYAKVRNGHSGFDYEIRIDAVTGAVLTGSM